MNEILLILSVLIYFGALLLMFKFFGKTGLYIWLTLATVLANIEVLIFVDAFGMGMTLGNVLFASTFLATDILSERYGKESANKAVGIGFMSVILFTLITSFWTLFTPLDADDLMFNSIKNIFSYIPRLTIASVLVYIIIQKLDIILYHKWWDYSKKKTGSSEKMLWLRNNGSTLISQLVNAVLFNIFAFYGTISNSELIGFILSTYVIFVVVSIIDTPIIYIASKMKVKEV